MKKITNMTITAWLSQGRFEGKSIGNGLYLSYRKDMKTAQWKFRYRLAGKQRALFIGNLNELSLAEARAEAKRLSAKVALGHDPQAEKQALKAQTKADADRITVAKLIEHYYKERVLPKLKEPEPIYKLLQRINSHIGNLLVESVTGKHINKMYQADLKRGYPASTNKMRQQTIRMFGFATAQHIISSNPAQWLDQSYAGGKAEPRKRSLSQAELSILLKDLSSVIGIQNALTTKLLLMLGVRKNELCQAKIEEFDLNHCIWHLPASRTKTNQAFDVPLPRQAVLAIQELIKFAGLSDYLLPARSAQHRQLPYISGITLGLQLKKVQGIEDFCVHDLRRTCKSSLQALGINEIVSERCLNHKIAGVQGTYGVHDFFDERKAALQLLADYLESCEMGREWNVIPINSLKHA